MSRYVGVEDLELCEAPEQPALSPDGTRVVYVLRRDDLAADRVVRSLRLVGTSSGEHSVLTEGPADSAPVWSPDGRSLAFLRPVEGVTQLHLLDLESGSVTPVTDHAPGVGMAFFDPAGERLAFVAEASAQPDVQVWSWGRPIVAQRLNYYADGDGRLSSPRRQVHVADLATNEVRQITFGDQSASSVAWSPDGTLLAFTAGVGDDADLTRASAVHLVDPAAAELTQRVVGSADGTVGPLVWAAKDALLVCGHEEGTGRFTGLLRLELDGPTRNLTEQLDRQVMYGAPGYPGSTPRLLSGGEQVLFCTREGGYVRPYVMDCEGGDAVALPLEDGVNVSALTVAGGSVAFMGGSADSFGEIYLHDLAEGSTRRLTDHRRSLGDLVLASREKRLFEISDGGRVEGWVMRDPAATGPRPVLLDIHGGPHNAWNGAAESVHLYHHELVSRGWVVLLLNSRGSDGYGEAFSQSLEGRWGIADTADFLEPLDQLVADGLVDPERMAVTGFSYGGFMTCYLTSRTDRFAAAVGGGVICDLVSSAGTCDNRRGLTETEWGGSFWEHPEEYAAMSPISTVTQVRAPTLLLHGADDVRCPLGQARQWHSALRVLGVPTELVVYPQASHTFLFNSPPSVRRDYNRRVVDWLVRYVG
ncbi:MAG: S9 family peptidase [Nocardioides sp.]